ncbi:cell wall-binding repeat-containing protein [Cellulosimicrobium protaetiae]|uniref:N-acetylmuramoyl-L-alanine amidase n=1 Tax=Cellulosimicrobium protaetiae TaxID=2587808 RepID=A0A6M5UDS7_9MICO|nr:cell wall-binding repeat-containing protein [Cellulosimicrobium protaetiae]QJW35218.1 hypothetical protein FIC82_002350 [Cellulosimicrobium protaetiae]
MPLLALSAALGPTAAHASSVAPSPEASGPSAPLPAAASALPDAGTAPATLRTDDIGATGTVTVAGGFQSAAVTWPADLDQDVPELQVRARVADGNWGPWTHVHRATDGPDTGGDATGDESTTVVYLGQSDTVQVAAVGTTEPLPDGVRVTTISSEPAPSPTADTAGAVPRARSAAAAAGPVIITREEWGAAPARCTWDAAPTLKGGVVHHTVNANGYSSIEQAMQAIRNDQAYHQDGNGWCDIGYNFLVDTWGNIYEGADGSIEKALIGAHTGGFNTGTVGVAMVGTFTDVTPPAAQLDGVAKIIGYRLAQYGVDPAGTGTFTAASKTAGGRFEQGQSVVLPRVFGHRDTHQTECPGDLAYRRLAHVQEVASQHYHRFALRAERISGTDRYATSAAISAATFDPGVPVAYVANGLSFPDALSGAPAAVASAAPVLLVSPTAVPASVADELRRLRPARIVALGGGGVVPETVLAQLRGLTAGSVTRLAGPDRFATSAAISHETFDPGVPVAYVANGLTFPDALAGAPAAGADGAPVLLVSPAAVPATVATELDRLRPGRIVILGGKGSVSAAVEQELGRFTSGGVDRASGPDRYATSAAVSRATFTPGVPVVYVANGLNFPDSLAGAPAAGVGGGPVLLTAPNDVPASVAAELDRLTPARVVVLGGSGVVSDAVRARVSAYVD